MMTPDPDFPRTYEEALEKAQELARNPDSLIPYRLHKLENASYGRGFAFLQTVPGERGDMDGYVLVATNRWGSGILVNGETIDTVIAEHLSKAAHDNREIPDSELSPAHRIALDAWELGHTRIADTPGRSAIDATTIDYAQYILIALKRNGRQGEPGRKILARNDFLLNGPAPGRRYTQPCPNCHHPTVYTERYPRMVCDDCHSRTTDRAGRRITGYNTHLSGGMIAYYSDTVEGTDSSKYEECVEITQTGRCFIDGHPAFMAEARMGGIVVQSLLPADKPRRRWFRRNR